MEFPLNTALRKNLLLGGALLVSVAYIFFALRIFAASWFGDQPELASLQRAARLDPWNADYHYHLGRYYALVARDPATAITSYRAAVQLNPHRRPLARNST